MAKLIPLIILFAIVAVLPTLLKLFQSGKKPAQSFPFQSQGKLFTPAERSFLGVLDQVVGDSFRVFGKVRLADVIKPKPGMTRSARQAAFNQIQSKHLDFVVCDPGDLSIQFAVELDDSSHNKPSRQSRDAFLEQAMAAAEIPLFRFPVKKGYALEEIRSTIFDSQEEEAEPSG
jgi:hypothetical protein